MPLSITKSLPAPCILVKRNLIDASVDGAPRATANDTSINARRSGRPRLEPLVGPEVLVRHLQHPPLELAVHARGVVLDRGPGEVGPRRLEVQHIAFVG